MKSIGNIQKITKTMEMVSVAKMKRAVKKTTESKLFAIKAQELLSLLAHNPKIQNHPLVAHPETIEHELMVIVASDKGLCGGYHVQLARSVRDYKTNSEHEISVVCIGKYAEKIANRFELPIVASFSALPETLDGDMLRPMRQFILGQYTAGTYQRVSVAYTEYVKALVYEPRIAALLPLDITAAESTEDSESIDYRFEPDPVQIFETVAPSMLAAIIYQFLLEAKAAEHSSRMVAMKNASDNASDLKDELTITYNRVRQAAITQEITEIISGASVIQ